MENRLALSSQQRSSLALASCWPGEQERTTQQSRGALCCIPEPQNRPAGTPSAHSWAAPAMPPALPEKSPINTRPRMSPSWPCPRAAPRWPPSPCFPREVLTACGDGPIGSFSTPHGELWMKGAKLRVRSHLPTGPRPVSPLGPEHLPLRGFSCSTYHNPGTAPSTRALQPLGLQSPGLQGSVPGGMQGVPSPHGIRHGHLPPSTQALCVSPGGCKRTRNGSC